MQTHPFWLLLKRTPGPLCWSVESIYHRTAPTPTPRVLKHQRKNAPGPEPMHAFALLKVCAERRGTQTRCQVMRGPLFLPDGPYQGCRVNLHGRSALTRHQRGFIRSTNSTNIGVQPALKTQTKRPGITVVIWQNDTVSGPRKPHMDLVIFRRNSCTKEWAPFTQRGGWSSSSVSNVDWTRSSRKIDCHRAKTEKAPHDYIILF